MEKNAVCALGVSEVQQKGHGEIKSADYIVYYSGGKRAERGIAIVMQKSTMRSVVIKTVCNDRISALKIKAEMVKYFICAGVHASIGV